MAASFNLHINYDDATKVEAKRLGEPEPEREDVFTLDITDEDGTMVTVFARLSQLEHIAGTINDLVADEAYAPLQRVSPDTVKAYLSGL